MSAPAPLQPGTIPPGTYAQGQRSPVVWVYLCAPCGGYPPITSPGYEGYLSGQCQGCGSYCPEVHKFPALIDSAAGCSCRGRHHEGKPVTGDLHAVQEPDLSRAVAAETERCAQLAERHRATYQTFCADRNCQHWHGTSPTGLASAGDLLRQRPIEQT